MKQLRAMPRTVKNRLAKAIDENADELVREARRDAPKASGALAGSIVKDPVEGSEGLVVEVETGLFYSRFQEFGTVKFPEQPFFFVNFRALRPRFNRRIGKAIREGLKDSLKK